MHAVAGDQHDHILQKTFGSDGDSTNSNIDQRKRVLTSISLIMQVEIAIIERTATIPSHFAK